MLRRLVLLAFVATSAHAQAPPVEWHAWSNEVFAQAAREHKFILLDLEAVWCHWCHVMDRQTYSNPEVRFLMARKYIAVKVDQDSRPDISNRYEDYGWPATVIFNADHREIVKRQGFLPPVQMASILKAVIDDPIPRAIRRSGEADRLCDGSFPAACAAQRHQERIRETI